MADNEEQVDWEDGDEGQDFWRGPEPSGTTAVSQVQPAADDDDDDVISLLGDTVAATPLTTEIATPAPLPEQTATPPSPLPAGWTSHMSKTHGRKYYIHTATSERRWDRPPMEVTAAAPLTPPLSPALPTTAAPTVTSKSSSIPTGPSASRASSTAAAVSAADQAAASAYASRHSKTLPAVVAPALPSGPRSQRNKRRESGSRFDAVESDSGYVSREAKRIKTQTEQGLNSSASQTTHSTNSQPLSPRPSRPLPSGPSNSGRDQRDRSFNLPRDDRRTSNQPRSSPAVARPPPVVRGANTAPVVNSRWGSKASSTPTGPAQSSSASAPEPAPAPTQPSEILRAPKAPTDAGRQAEIDRAIAEGIRLGREQERKRIADEEAALAAKRRADEQAAERRKAIEQREAEEKRQREAAPSANRWGTRGARAPEVDRGFPSRPIDGPSRPPAVSNGFRGPPPGADNGPRRSPERRERSPVRNARPPIDRPGSASRTPSTYDSYKPGDRGRERSPPPPNRWGRPPARSPSPIKDPRFTRRLSPPRGIDRYTPSDGPARPGRSLQERMEPRAVVAEPMSRRSPPPRGYPMGRSSPYNGPPLASRMAVGDRAPPGPDRRGEGRGGRR